MRKQEDQIELSFYTDPLCCWSYALLPEIEKLENQFSGKLSVRFCMGGLIPKWDTFSDPMNSINRPSQMGPLWMDAARKTGIQFNESIWVDDPPSSSYPACIAVKTAQLQSAEAGEAYLKLVMEKVMLEAQNTAKPEVLLSIANELEAKNPNLFNTALFANAYNREESRNAFRQDLQKVKIHSIGRFPTVTLTRSNKPGIIFTGYRPYSVLLDAFFSIAPELKETDQI